MASTTGAMSRVLILAVLLVHLFSQVPRSVSAARNVPAVVSHDQGQSAAASSFVPALLKVERRLSGDQEDANGVAHEVAPVSEVSRCRVMCSFKGILKFWGFQIISSCELPVLTLEIPRCLASCFYLHWVCRAFGCLWRPRTERRSRQPWIDTCSFSAHFCLPLICRGLPSQVLLLLARSCNIVVTWVANKLLTL